MTPTSVAVATESIASISRRSVIDDRPPDRPGDRGDQLLWADADLLVAREEAERKNKADGVEHKKPAIVF
ncbi:hypothetical protein [Bradyrhizobium sp. RD5-C2]|uniref:hypothetical protein n=1 Tax=Bradyrhizobium sp. RD5-C2 TaxID=244562 RepID=UPI001CC4495B|nr:hypothetical protein [Bradyrhizobium sp. RD5-C2]